MIDLEDLARAVDARVHRRPADRSPARLYGVSESSTSPDGIALQVLATGDPHPIVRRTRPPAGLVAIALSVSGWAAPLSAEGEEMVRPSVHPERRRIHHTALIVGDGEDVGVMRYADEGPKVMRGACGVVHELLLDCWARRPDAPGGRARASVRRSSSPSSRPRSTRRSA